MNNRVIFRLAVIGVLVFETALLAALHFFDDGALDPAFALLPAAVGWDSFFESSPVIGAVIGLSLISLFLASLIGVLMFRKWGRWLYLVVTVLVIPVSVFSGPTIYYGWESALWNLVNMVNGAIILAMFLPPISSEFNTLSKQDAASSAAA